MEELRFVAKLRGSTKPVKKYHETEDEGNNFIPMDSYQDSYRFVTDTKEPLS